MWSRQRKAATKVFRLDAAIAFMYWVIHIKFPMIASALVGFPHVVDVGYPKTTTMVSLPRPYWLSRVVLRGRTPLRQARVHAVR